jgi:hypothetical protein
MIVGAVAVITGETVPHDRGKLTMEICVINVLDEISQLRVTPCHSPNSNFATSCQNFEILSNLTQQKLTLNN